MYFIVIFDIISPIKNKERLIEMKAMINNVNIRGCESRKNKKGDPYLLVRFEDETGTPCEMVDKDMRRQHCYTRNTEGSLTIDIDVGKYTTLRIVDFQQNGEM